MHPINMKNILFILLLNVLLVSADIVEVYSTSCVTLWVPDTTGEIFARRQGIWQAVTQPLVSPQGTTEFAYSIAQGVELNDFEAPIVRSVLVNGLPISPVDGTQRYLLSLLDATKEVEIVVEDALNSVEPNETFALLDGELLSLSFERGKKVGISCLMEGSKIGRHCLEFVVGDNAPIPNLSRLSFEYEVVDASNYIRSRPGVASVEVDSNYMGYPSVAPLTDGVNALPGSTAENDVTWASLDNGAEHWIRVELKSEVDAHAFDIYWPRLTNCSQFVEAQVLRDGKWVTVASSGKKAQAPTLLTSMVPDGVIRGKVFRFYQPENGGPASREGIMWVCEVVIR